MSRGDQLKAASDSGSCRSRRGLLYQARLLSPGDRQGTELSRSLSVTTTSDSRRSRLCADPNGGSGCGWEIAYRVILVWLCWAGKRWQ